MVMLPKNLTFSRRVQMVCLPSTKLTFDGFPATVSGWGLLAGNDPSSVPMKLHEVELTVVSNTACKQSYNSAGTDLGSVIQPEMLCATAPDKGICSGDSGGKMGGYNTLLFILYY